MQSSANPIDPSIVRKVQNLHAFLYQMFAKSNGKFRIWRNHYARKAERDDIKKFFQGLSDILTLPTYSLITGLEHQLAGLIVLETETKKIHEIIERTIRANPQFEPLVKLLQDEMFILQNHRALLSQLNDTPLTEEEKKDINACNESILSFTLAMVMQLKAMIPDGELDEALVADRIVTGESVDVFSLLYARILRERKKDEKLCQVVRLIQNLLNYQDYVARLSSAISGFDNGQRKLWLAKRFINVLARIDPKKNTINDGLATFLEQNVKLYQYLKQHIEMLGGCEISFRQALQYKFTSRLSLFSEGSALDTIYEDALDLINTGKYLAAQEKLLSSAAMFHAPSLQEIAKMMLMERSNIQDARIAYHFIRAAYVFCSVSDREKLDLKFLAYSAFVEAKLLPDPIPQTCENVSGQTLLNLGATLKELKQLIGKKHRDPAIGHYNAGCFYLDIYESIAEKEPQASRHLASLREACRYFQDAHACFMTQKCFVAAKVQSVRLNIAGKPPIPEFETKLQTLERVHEVFLSNVQWRLAPIIRSHCSPDEKGCIETCLEALGISVVAASLRPEQM